MSRWRRIFTVVHNFVEEELASVPLQPKVAIIAGTRLIFHFLAVYLLACLAFRCSSLPHHHQPALRLLLPQMGFCCSCSAHLVVNMSSTLLSSTDGDRGKTIPPDQCPHNIHLHCIIRSPVVWLWRWWSRYHCPSSAPPTTHVSHKTFLTAIILHLQSSHHHR